MFAEEVRFDASELLAVIDLDAHVKVQRTDGSAPGSAKCLQPGLGFADALCSPIRLQRGNKFVILCVTPSRSVVTSAADGAVDKRVWIAVIANPA